MITDLGKVHIKRFLAGWEPELAQSIAFGVGDSVESSAQDRLDFEIGRTDISLTTYNYLDDKLIFKGVIDELFDGVIYEVGLYASAATESAVGGSKLILSFDSETEFWTQAGLPATYSTSSTRIGNDSLVAAPAASGSVTSTYADLLADLSGYTAADTFSFALYSANANVASIVFKFYTDDANYYTVTVPGAQIASGFNLISIPIAQSVATGAPRWETITKVDATVSATSGGAASVQLEGVRMEDIDNTQTGNILIARTKLAVPFVKLSGTIQEVEFPLGVTI